MITNAMFRFAYRRFRSACRDPFAAQSRRLRRILHDAAHTTFGRDHGFSRLTRVSSSEELVRAYQREVPIRTWSEMGADLDAVYRGDWARLCPSAPIWFAMTAGSTGAYKYVPVTPEYRRDVGRASMIFQGALDAAFPDTRGLRTQFLVGTAEGGTTPAGVPQGFASGFNYRKLPWFLRRRFVVPYWIFTLDDPEERAYAAGRVLIDEARLGTLAAISPVNLINLRRSLDRNADRLLADVSTGRLTVDATAAVPGTWHGRPSPERARRLAAGLRADGRFANRDLFPSLRVLVCWQGGSMSYYMDELRQAFGIERTFEFPISASEGIYAIPHRANRSGGVLAVTTHFLEFIGESGEAEGAVRRVDELTDGATYRLVLSTAGGLYRYDTEDLVRVVSFEGPTPVIEFVSKAGRRVSVSNERMTEEEVTLAMSAASRTLGCRFEHFLFVPCSDRRYRILLDGAEAGAPAMEPVLAALVDEIDRQLREHSTGYDFEREDALIDPPRVVVTSSGALRRYLAARGPSGSLPNAQVKPFHLTPEFDVHEAFRAEKIHAISCS